MKSIVIYANRRKKDNQIIVTRTYLLGGITEEEVAKIANKDVTFIKDSPNFNLDNLRLIGNVNYITELDLGDLIENHRERWHDAEDITNIKAAPKWTQSTTTRKELLQAFIDKHFEGVPFVAFYSYSFIENGD